MRSMPTNDAVWSILIGVAFFAILALANFIWPSHAEAECAAKHGVLVKTSTGVLCLHVEEAK